MFDFFRKKGKAFTFLLMLLVIPSFIFGGMELYRRSFGGGDANAVAVVDGQSITQQEWDAAHTQWVQQIKESSPNLDDSLLNSSEMRYRTLLRLVDERVLAAAARRSRISVTDQQVAEALMQIPEVAALRGADGKIDREAYAQLLRYNNRTEEEFEAFIHSQLTQQQVIQGISAAAGWQPSVLTGQAIQPMLERREIQIAQFPTDDYIAQVHSTEDELQAWYKQHAAQRYTVAEQVDVEYIVLDEAAVLKRYPLTEADLKKWFDANQAKYGTPETRRASHILIMADEKADAATHEAAQKKAEEILQQLKAKPEQFADLAKQHSQDPGSAAKGGDLGFFNKETMVKPFADATFSMKEGDISEVVKSAFGYHIIRLDAINPSGVPALDTIRARVEQDFQAERAKQMFAQDATLLADIASKNRDSLKVVAEKMGLDVQVAKELTRTPKEAPTVFDVDALSKAVFAPIATSGKQVSDPVNVGGNHLVVFKVADHRPEHVQTFDAVKGDVKAAYAQEKAAELAQAAGKEQLQKWQQNPSSATFAAPVVVSRMDVNQQHFAILDAAMHADAEKLPVLEGANLGAQGYAVVRVNKVLETDASAAAAMQAQLAPNVQEAAAQALIQAYLDTLKQKMKVTIRVPAPATVGG